MPGRLEGKVAIVTGAASGMGAAAAALFAAEGASVAAFDINTDGLQTLSDSHADDLLPVTCDLTSADAVRDGVSQVVERFGQIDVLVNVAGIRLRGDGPWDASQDGPVVDITDEVFDRVMAINMKSQLLTCRYSIPHLLSAGGGSIVNVASIGGVFVGSANAGYCASKGAIVGLTLSLACTYARRGIRANVLCPGLINTPMTERLVNNPDYAGPYSMVNPLGRFGEAREVATAALFLASDDSSYLNGLVIPVDGGALRSPAWAKR